MTSAAEGIDFEPIDTEQDTSESPSVLVSVDGLEKYFYEQDTLIDRLFGVDPVAIRAVDGLTFDVYEGETLGLVGESGCGKSTTGETLLGLQAATDGTVTFDGVDVFEDIANIETTDAVAPTPVKVLAAVLSLLGVFLASLGGYLVLFETSVSMQAFGGYWVVAGILLLASGVWIWKLRLRGWRIGLGVLLLSVLVLGIQVPLTGVFEASWGVLLFIFLAGYLLSRRVAFVDPPHIRRRAQIVFQDPFSSLDPRMTVADIVRQPLDVHEVGTEDERRRRVEELIERVGLSTEHLDRYPNEFSGGQRQRIGIARAIALDPDFLVLDEPTSALDVSIQAQILNLLEDLKDEFGLTYLIISHDLSVIRHVCDRVAVMYLGELVEVGPADAVFSDPQHPYTSALLESVPRPDVDERDREVSSLRGDVPSPRNPPSGCRFRTRCPQVIPPSALGLEQAQYRAVMDVRERIAREELSVGEHERGDTREETIEEVVDRVLETELPEEHERLVHDAVKLAIDGDFEEANVMLRDRYESVCERISPVLQGGVHEVSCHLHWPPEGGDR